MTLPEPTAHLIARAKVIAQFSDSGPAQREVITQLVTALEAATDGVEWEYPRCGVDAWGKSHHSVNCECFGPMEHTPLRRRKAGPLVPAPPTDY